MTTGIRRPRAVAWKPLWWTSGPALLALAAVAAAKVVAGVPIDRMTAEATTVFGAPPYVGALSLLGLLGWSAAAALAFFASRHACYTPDRAAVRRYLLGFGLLTSALLVDDGFRFHETVLPALGVPELVTYAVLGASTAALFLGHQRVVLAGPWHLLVAALVALSASVALDVGSQALGHGGSGYYLEVFAEDGLKFLGIAGWLAYAAAEAAYRIRPAALSGPARS